MAKKSCFIYMTHSAVIISRRLFEKPRKSRNLLWSDHICVFSFVQVSLVWIYIFILYYFDVSFVGFHKHHGTIFNAGWASSTPCYITVTRQTPLSIKQRWRNAVLDEGIKERREDVADRREPGFSTSSPPWSQSTKSTSLDPTGWRPCPLSRLTQDDIPFSFKWVLVLAAADMSLSSDPKNIQLRLKLDGNYNKCLVWNMKMERYFFNDWFRFGWEGKCQPLKRNYEKTINSTKRCTRL